MEDPHEEHRVDGCIGQRQVVRVRPSHARPESRVRPSKHGFGQVDAHDGRPDVAQRHGDDARADPDLDDAGPAEQGLEDRHEGHAASEAAACLVVAVGDAVERDRAHGEIIAAVIPVVTPEEMAAIDRAAPEPVETLVERAGSAVAWAARRLLGGTYGRRVVVVAGKGNNGNDGRAAAARLAAGGVRVEVVDAAAAPATLPPADLVVDAAYGTGFRGDYEAPDACGTPVLAVDVPSGVDGLTGAAGEGAVRAEHTVTFAALKPGLLLPPGRDLAGEVEVADIGLDVSSARAHVVEAADIAAWIPVRATAAHKWQSAVWVIAGSPGMTGAAALVCRGAQRAGAGYVRLSVPGADDEDEGPVEVVRTALDRRGWATDVLHELGRFSAVVVGPGLGREHDDDVRALVAGASVPVVVDGDGLTALGTSAAACCRATTVLTPHDGEFERLAGERPAADRIDAARRLAARTRATVLLKGPTTVVAASGGDVLLGTEGDARLATAGTGDVLSGVIAALLAGGLDPVRAAAAAAWLHGRAGHLGSARGLVAGDLPDRLPVVYDELEEPPDAPRHTRP
jgi:NAD(P)H-hydrate epimerase